MLQNVTTRPICMGCPRTAFGRWKDESPARRASEGCRTLIKCTHCTLWSHCAKCPRNLQQKRQHFSAVKCNTCAAIHMNGPLKGISNCPPAHTAEHFSSTFVSHARSNARSALALQYEVLILKILFHNDVTAAM